MLPHSAGAGSRAASVAYPASSLHALSRSASEAAIINWDYEGWLLKTAPRAFDCDKPNSLQRELGKAVRPR